MYLEYRQRSVIQGADDVEAQTFEVGELYKQHKMYNDVKSCT